MMTLKAIGLMSLKIVFNLFLFLINKNVFSIFKHIFLFLINIKKTKIDEKTCIKLVVEVGFGER